MNPFAGSFQTPATHSSSRRWCFEAGVFVELAGEDLRRRLYLTSAADGTELALRPDFTIPVCLHHLATGKPNRRADYAYLGPVFRQRQGESGEFLQAGVESLGRADRAAADADMLQLSLAACRLLGVKKPTVRIGNSGLFAAVMTALEISEPWRRRLSRAFGDPARLAAVIAKAEGEKAPPRRRRPTARRQRRWPWNNCNRPASSPSPAAPPTRSPTG